MWICLFLCPQYVFVTNNPASGNSATTHEVLATAVTAILKQTADFNTSNKLLKVSICVSAHHPVSCSTNTQQQLEYLPIKWLCMSSEQKVNYSNFCCDHILEHAAACPLFFILSSVISVTFGVIFSKPSPWLFPVKSLYFRFSFSRKAASWAIPKLI